MQVLLNTDSHIDGRQAMPDHLEALVREALGHYGERITRVEAHLTDANGAARGGPDDIHCTLEARPVGREPVVLSAMDVLRRERFDLARAYRDDSADGLMDTDTLAVQPDTTLATAAAYLVTVR